MNFLVSILASRWQSKYRNDEKFDKEQKIEIITQIIAKETELMRTARSSTRCSPRKNSRMLCCSFSPTNKTCQAP